MRIVKVTSYNSEWPSQFEEEAAILREIFKENLIAIHHIGSTSVSGLQAKPIIDIMPVVNDISKVDQFNEQMQIIDYEPMGEYGITGRKYFRKGKEERTHHVHVFQYGSYNILRHLAFRDYLRAHPNVRNSYGELKVKLATQFPNDMASYINGKDALVQEIEREAIEWFSN
ncbi:GrpB family protein [Oceanobacillus sp. CAU 1775]